MKHYLAITLALICIVLVVSLVVVKRNDDVQYKKDADAITDFSNRLDSARVQIASCNEAILTLSNRLDESQSASLAFSNHMMEAESTIALDAERITNLNRRIAAVGSENQILDQRVMDLTNRLASAEASLNKADKDYALLENRLRRDVAERLVVERKFNNPSELQAQMQYLKENPTKVISADSIYTSLGVEVESNAFHVISPN